MDTIKSLEPILSELPFLKGLTPEQIRLITGCASNVSFEPDSLLFKEGDSANTFYILRKGRIALELSAPGQGKITLQTCGENETVGWSWLIGPHQWRYTGRALLTTRAIAIDGACLRGKCDEDHELGYELLKRVSDVLAHRLEATRLQLLDLYSSK